MVTMIDEALGKRRSYGEPWNMSVLVKDGYRLIAVTNMSATFNKLSIFVFCVYFSRSSSTCAIGNFYLHSK